MIGLFFLAIAYLLVGVMICAILVRCTRNLWESALKIPTRPLVALGLSMLLLWPLLLPWLIVVMGRGIIYFVRGLRDLYRLWRPAKVPLPTATAKEIPR